MGEPIVYRKLKSGNLQFLKKLLAVYETVFEMEDFHLPGDAYLQTLLERESMIFYVAVLNKEVVGGLSAHVLPSVYFESAEVYIFDLGVKPSLQRRGIGRELILALTDYCKKQNYKEIFVQADKEDHHAREFYKGIGGQAEKVVHYTYSLK